MKNLIGIKSGKIPQMSFYKKVLRKYVADLQESTCLDMWFFIALKINS